MNDDIIFLEEDSLAKIAEKTVLIWAGSNELRVKLKKLNVEYVKLQRGLHVIYALTSKEFGRIEVRL